MGLGGTGTPKRSWPKQARRKRIILTSRHFLSPLDTGPSRPLPEGLRPAAEVHGPPPTRGGRLRRHAALAHRGGGAGGRHRGRVQPHGGAHLGPTPHEKAQSAAPTSHRMRFSVTSPPGRRGARPPASLRGTMENDPTGQTRSDNPPPGCGGGCAGDPQASAWGPASRKSAVWAEGLAESAPRVGPGHHQAASCGLRGCRELSITSRALSAPPAPAPLVPRAQGDGR